MITIEQLNKAIEEECNGDDAFIKNHSYMDYSDILEEYRTIINELGLSFWVSELDGQSTIVYTRVGNIIHILDEGLNEYESVKEYLDWLNEMETKALLFNR